MKAHPIETFLSRIDIVVVAKKLFHQHRITKKGDLIAICFSHPETNPSLRVHHGSQRAHCFGCGGQWDAISLVMEYHHTDTKGALEWLSAQFDIPPPSTKTHPKKARQRNRKRTQAHKKKRCVEKDKKRSEKARCRKEKDVDRVALLLRTRNNTRTAEDNLPF
jgi:DNA primase